MSLVAPVPDTRSVDPPVRPQDDLFRSVNAGWLAITEIPADQAGYGAFQQLRDAAEAACRDLITEAAAAGAPAGSPEQLIGDLWASFMNTDPIKAAGADTIGTLLARVAAVTDIEGLLELTGSLRRRGIGGVLGLAVSSDADDPDRYVTYLYQSGLGLPDESYYREEQYAEIRAGYAVHVRRMLELAGVTEPDRVAAAAIELETELAAAHWDRVRCRDRTQTHNPYGRAALDDLLPGPLWDAFCAGLSAPPGVLDRADVMQPSFFGAAAGLLTADRLARWQDWLTWRVVHALAPYCGTDLVEENFAFYGRTLSGTPTLRERWKRGVGLVEGGVGEALGKLYVERHFAPTAKARMDELVANLLAAYRGSISELTWMTDETKAAALDKLGAFRPKIGFPTRFREYPGLRIERDDLLGNVARCEAAELDRDLAKIGTPVDRDEWLMTPQTVNAYYNPAMNEIVFPAAILQPPYFEASADDATNYGGIGAVIGHEIGHGFDDQGSKYDGTGALRDWWTPADRAAFDELTGKLVDQYAALSPEGANGRPVNGRLTLGENIGDLGGLGIALRAWRLAGAPNSAGLDSGGEPDPERLRRFFDNWARAWRNKTRPAEVARRLTLDPHSPPEFRANQVVRNLAEFYRAYDVTDTDELWLDPADRVRIW